MCKVKVVIRREMLGAREQSWSCWTGKESGVKELKASEIKREIRNGNRVYGLKIGEDGELALDKEGFFTSNVVEHRQSDNFKLMIEDDQSMGNVALVCVGKHRDGDETVYECINNRFGMEEISKEDMRVYIRLGIVCSGAKMMGNEIIVASIRNETAAVTEKEEDGEEGSQETNGDQECEFPFEEPVTVEEEKKTAEPKKTSKRGRRK